MTDFLTLAQARYSCRRFAETPVSDDDLQYILEAGRVAPTACNRQPQRVHVLRSGEALAKLRLCTRCHFGCSVALLVCYDVRESWKRGYDGQDSGWVDASIVTTHMMLAAHEKGIENTWVMHFDPAAVREQFALPENEIPVAILVMGHPAEEAAPGPMHADNKPLEDTVTYC